MLWNNINFNANPFIYGTCWDPLINRYKHQICKKVGDDNFKVASVALKAIANFVCTLVGGILLSVAGLQFKAALVGAVIVCAVTACLASSRPGGYDRKATSEAPVSPGSGEEALARRSSSSSSAATTYE